MYDLKGKKVLILGVANEKSIAWGIAKAFKSHGASVALTYLNEALQKRVQPLAESISADFTCRMDVTCDGHYDSLASTLEKNWKSFDVMVHSLAFANRDDLKDRFYKTSREGFSLACDISAYSLIALSRAMKNLFNKGSSIIAMTYHGSQQVVPGYNIMGVAKAALEASSRYLAADLGQDNIRVNCISAGPIRTLASSGVSGLKKIFTHVEQNSPLGRNITTDDVGKVALWLGGPYSEGVTGQIIYVDSGMSIKAL